MGLLMRLKLEALPIVDIDNMGAAFLALASASVEPKVLKRMEEDHKAKLRKYCKDYRSLTDIDAYAVEQKRISKFGGMYGTWKRVGPYLVYFSGMGMHLRLGIPPFPRACIIRIGPSTWRVTDLSAMEQDIEDSDDSTLDASESECKPHPKCKPSKAQVKPGAATKPKAKSKAKRKTKTKRKVSANLHYLFVASLDGKYFHQPNCAVVKNIREENLIGFYSADEPKSAGLKRCGKCKSIQTKTKP